MKFLAYRHVNGNIHVKRLSEQFANDEIDDAADSDFVDNYEVIEAENRAEAERIAKGRLAK